jgi:predicted nuclease of predicted toxin-antitoxin system
VNFVADGSVDGPVVDQFRQDGHVVEYVAEMDPGVDDDEVLTLSNQLGAPLLTVDKDFGELVYRLGRVTHGVILIRLAGLSLSTKAALVARAVRQHEHALVGAFTVISPGAIRIRQRI